MTPKHVLVISNSDDPHVHVVLSRLQERSCLVHRIDSDTFVHEMHGWRIPASETLRSTSSWFIEGVDVVWYRKVMFPEAKDAVSFFVKQELTGLFDSLVGMYEDVRWVNRLESIRRSRPKVAQLERAKRLGFRVPDTLIATSVQALRDFGETHDGRIVVKPIGTQVVGIDDDAVVLGTRRISKECYRAAVFHTPCYAQELLNIVHEMRVIVFGKHIVPFRLIPKREVDDIKRLKLSEIHHEVCELDAEVQQKIHSIMEYYQLEFAAIDFAVTDEGEPTFLELNPNGQWLWLQYCTGENLVDPFIDHLCA